MKNKRVTFEELDALRHHHDPKSEGCDKTNLTKNICEIRVTNAKIANGSSNNLDLPYHIETEAQTISLTFTSLLHGNIDAVHIHSKREDLKESCEHRQKHSCGGEAVSKKPPTSNNMIWVFLFGLIYTHQANETPAATVAITRKN